MFYVKIADGREALFIGDIAWVLSNVNALATRPRFTQQFFMATGEDRATVADQIRALHDLMAAEPSIAMIPAHDGPLITGFTAAGLFKPQFTVDAP
jgi:hypothetical protein